MKKLILIVALLLFLPVFSYGRMLQGAVAGGASTPDTTPPTLTTVTIETNGTSWTYVYSEAVTCAPTSDCCDDFTVDVAGGPIAQIYASGSGSNTVVCTGSPTVLSGEAVTAGLDYMQPGDGIEDLAGNDLASIDDKAVTNNSTQTTGIALEGSASNIGTSNAPTITHGLTISAGDVVLCFLSVDGTSPEVVDNNGTTPFTTTFWENHPNAESMSYYIFERVAGGTEPAAYSFTMELTVAWTIQIRVYSGVDNASIWDVTPAAATRGFAGSGTTATSASMTTIANGAMGVALFMTDGTVTYSAVTNSYINEREHGSGRSMASYDRIFAVAGNQGAVAATLSGDNDWVAHQFALNPD